MANAASPAPHPTPPQPPPQAPTDPKRALTVNALRLKAIGERLRDHLSGMSILPVGEFVHLTYAFARGIDFAVSAGDIPVVANEIPAILRKIYELRKETFIQSSLMVLVISCKNACSKKWFQPTDSSDILRIANELSGNFCTSSGQAASDSAVLEIISQIMPRYYPWLKFGRLITSIEAKVGYDVLMSDFFIERNLSRDEKIRLIVVQKENLDASTCVTSPPHVRFVYLLCFDTCNMPMLNQETCAVLFLSFLVNGKGVDKRTNVSMDLGPQFPSDITKMLKYGANIIQAVGYFNANYIIAVAFINNVASFSAPKLDDYTQPITVYPADSDVLEGPSRVSLNCPISLKRIKTPIKGRLCKHYQCFDYDNYMEMNSRKPNWRCPYCNTPSNFTDLRIDQKMAKILEETGDDVVDVLVFADGSWKAAPAHDEKSDSHRGDAIHQTVDATETDSSSSDVIDLINGDGDGDGDPPMMDWASALEDKKPLQNSQDISVSDYFPDFPMAAQTEDLYVGDGNNGETHCETVQLQSQIGPVHRSEVRRLPIPRNPRREPVGVQALPEPPQNPGSSTRLQPNILNCPPPIPLSTPASSTYQAHQVTNPDYVSAPMNNSCGPLPRTPSAATSLHLQSTTRDMRNTSSHLPGRVVGPPAPHLMGALLPPGNSGQAGGANTYRPMPIQQTPTHDQLMHTRMTMNQTALAAVVQTTAAALVRPTQAEIQSRILPSLQSQMPRSQSVPRAATPQSLRVPPHLQPPSVPPAAPSTPQAGSSDGLPPDLPVDENWCPTGQMRGSLTGNAYNSAILRYQPAQARPSSTVGARRPH